SWVGIARRGRVGVAWGGAALALSSIPGGGSASTTTAPGGHVAVPGLFTNKGIGMGDSGRFQRGGIGTFWVRNNSSRPQNFAVAGHKTGRIAPGRVKALTVPLVRRGLYLYRSELDNARRFRGILVVV